MSKFTENTKPTRRNRRSKKEVTIYYSHYKLIKLMDELRNINYEIHCGNIKEILLEDQNRNEHKFNAHIINMCILKIDTDNTGNVYFVGKTIKDTIYDYISTDTIVTILMKDIIKNKSDRVIQATVKDTVVDVIKTYILNIDDEMSTKDMVATFLDRFKNRLKRKGYIPTLEAI